MDDAGGGSRPSESEPAVGEVVVETFVPGRARVEGDGGRSRLLDETDRAGFVLDLGRVVEPQTEAVGFHGGGVDGDPVIQRQPRGVVLQGVGLVDGDPLARGPRAGAFAAYALTAGNRFQLTAEGLAEPGAAREPPRLPVQFAPRAQVPGAARILAVVPQIDEFYHPATLDGSDLGFEEFVGEFDVAVGEEFPRCACAEQRGETAEDRKKNAFHVFAPFVLTLRCRSGRRPTSIRLFRRKRCRPDRSSTCTRGRGP